MEPPTRRSGLEDDAADVRHRAALGVVRIGADGDADDRRIRYIVLQSGNDRLDRWVSERRDLAADFMRLFKDESPNSVPPIIGIAIGADSDNTKSRSVSYVSGIVLEP